MKISDVVDRLEEMLAAMTAGTPPAPVWGTVSRDFELAEGTQWPAVMVVIPEIGLQDRSGLHGQGAAQVQLFFIVRDETSPTTAMLNLQAEIIKTLAQDRTLEGACRSVRPVKGRVAAELFPEGVIPGYMPPFAGWCLDMEVEYIYDQLTEGA